MNSEELKIEDKYLEMFDLYLTLFDNIRISKDRLLAIKISNNDDYRKMLYELLVFLNAVYTFKEFIGCQEHPIFKAVHSSYYQIEREQGWSYRFILEYRNIIIHDLIIPRVYIENGEILLNTHELKQHVKNSKENKKKRGKKRSIKIIQKVYNMANYKVGNDYIFLNEVITNAYSEMYRMYMEMADYLYGILIEDSLEELIKKCKDTNVEDVYNFCLYFYKCLGTNPTIARSISMLLQQNGIQIEFDRTEDNFIN